LRRLSSILIDAPEDTRLDIGIPPSKDVGGCQNICSIHWKSASVGLALLNIGDFVETAEPGAKNG
jgi:hypothetical protein